MLKIRNGILALYCFFICVKLAKSTDFYLLKVLKGPPVHKIERNQNEDGKKIYLQLAPLTKAAEKGEKDETGTEKFASFPCRPGHICIGKVQHNQNSVVINNDLRDPAFYSNHLNFLEDKSTDTDEYIALDDDYQPFRDLTRLEKIKKQKKDMKRRTLKHKGFSTDYIDINDLLRNKILKKKTKNYSRKAAEAKMVETQGKYFVRAESSDSSDSSSSGEKIDSSDEGKYSKKKIPKRFEVIDNKKKKKQYFYSDTSKSAEANDLDDFKPITMTPKPKKRKPLKEGLVDNFEDMVEEKKEVYMQSPGNFVKLGPESQEDFRRRLQYFLPKRYHWNEDDFQKLGYYWFNGPQGKYPGPWRISY